ncbi:MAG: c-type cytochrome [Thermoanaerobaculia bacterium]
MILRVPRIAPVLLAAAPAFGQIPDTFTNLKVFPKDIPKARLVEAMKGFVSATGLRCDGCHMGGPALDEINFPSDGKETKRTARAMMAMVRAINDDHIARLDRAKDVRVVCATCHHGVSKPVLLDRLLAATVREKGLDAAVARYRDLRRAYYGRAAYDFGEPTLNAAAQELLADGKAKEAIGLVELNLEFGAHEVSTYNVLADARLAAGDRPGAVAALRKAVEIEPKADFLKKKLERLEKPGP